MDDKKWDGRITNIKVSDRTYPELYNELAMMQYKERSDRLKLLAYMGLMSLSRPMAVTPVAPLALATQPVVDQAEDQSLGQEQESAAFAKHSLKGKLLGSIG